MDQTTRSVNFILICIVNGFFIVAGVFLNSVVIIGLSKSSHLLKRLCYFMILVLTCFDLATVTVCHPWIMISSYIWSTGDFDAGNIYHRIRNYTNILSCFSFLALLTLNIDRFLAIRYPLFHKQSVTRRRLMALLLVLLLIFLVERVLAYTNIFGIVCYATEAVLIGFLLVVVFLINYKMFTIAKAARKRRTAPVKNVSTCILAVVCFFVFFSPLIVYSAMRFVPNKVLRF